MLTFSLNTFIKICLMDTGSRISEIQKRLSSTGGYDFYKTLHKAIRTFATAGQDKVEEILAAPVNDVERKRNRDAFLVFQEKFGATKSLDAVKMPKLLKFPDAGIAISVDAAFQIVKGGTLQIYSVWPTQKPELSQKYGALACHIMRRTYSNTAFANASFFYADLVSEKSYSEKQVTNNTNLILMADVSSIGTLIKEL